MHATRDRKKRSAFLILTFKQSKHAKHAIFSIEDHHNNYKHCIGKNLIQFQTLLIVLLIFTFHNFFPLSPRNFFRLTVRLLVLSDLGIELALSEFYRVKNEAIKEALVIQNVKFYIKLHIC